MIRTTLAQTNLFVLHKNFLAAEKAATPGQLIERLAGLPAEPRLTPFLAAWARLSHFSPRNFSQSPNFITAPLLRGVPYLVHVDDFACWLAAAARQRAQLFNAEFRLWGIDSNAEIEQLGRQILAELGERPASAGEIRAGLPQVKSLTQTSRGGRVSTITTAELALRWLVGTGQLAAVNQAEDWRAEEVIYWPLRQRYSGLDLAQLPAEADAQKRLVRAYLAAFGPTTEADISFWTGFGKSETARATGALAAETTLVLVQGLPGMLLLLKEQAEALTASPAVPAEPLLNVLPANDPYLTAHRASRARYCAEPSLQRQVFAGSGAAKPAILLNGQVIGLWSGDAAAGWQLLAAVDPALEPAIAAKVAAAGAFLQTG